MNPKQDGDQMNEDARNESFSQRVRGTIWEDPSFPAKFLPYENNDAAWVIPGWSYACSDEASEDQMPVPPQELWDGHWSDPAR